MYAQIPSRRAAQRGSRALHLYLKRFDAGYPRSLHLKKKLRVGVVFGGRSGEHEVSLRSATSIIQSMDRRKYEVVLIGITKEGKWLGAGKAQALLPADIFRSDSQNVAVLGDPTHRGLLHIGAKDSPPNEPLDVLFPVLHGTFGEDGTIQGLLEMANIPYVGCGVLASSTGMDKVVMKQLFASNGLPIVPYEWFLRSTWERSRKKIVDGLARKIGFPAFVKPANLGSSVGVSKVVEKSGLAKAVDFAAEFDRKIVVEKGVDARELEVSVLGNDEPVASLPGEIMPGAEFYDYKDKYITDGARLVIPAKVPARIVRKLQEYAVRAFRSIDGSGLARVDFFFERKTSRVLVNEINTLPGFTSISMFPKLWEESGVPYSKLIDHLIELAIERHRDKSRSRYAIDVEKDV